MLIKDHKKYVVEFPRYQTKLKSYVNQPATCLCSRWSNDDRLTFVYM